MEQVTFEALVTDALKRLESGNSEQKATEAMIIEAGGELIQSGYLPYDKKAFRELAEYFAAPNGKGLLLSGKSGTGKTHLFRSRMNKTRICTAVKIEQAWKNHGTLNDPFWYDLYCCFYSWDQPGNIDIIIDDLGQEPITKNYGNVSEVIEQLACYRYQQWQVNGVKTHFSSNLSHVELDKRYGRRVTDRLREMCRLIEFKENSNRGAKQALNAIESKGGV